MAYYNQHLHDTPHFSVGSNGVHLMIENNLSRRYYNKSYPSTRDNPKALKGLEQQISSMFALAGEDMKSTKGKSCLELGSGTGEETLVLIKKYGLKVTAVEFNHDSIEQAQELMSKQGVSTNVRFIEQDLHNLNLGGEKFDFIFSKGVLHHLHTPSQAVLKVLSCLREGGGCIFRVNWFYGWMFKKGGIINYAMLKLLYVLFPDPKRRMSIGERWFYDSRLINSQMDKDIVIYDNFGSIYKPMRLAQFLEWFRESGIAYSNSFPNHAFKLLLERDFKLFEARSSEKLLRKLAKIFFIKTRNCRTKIFLTPSFFSRAVVQFLYLFILRIQLTLTVVGTKSISK